MNDEPQLTREQLLAVTAPQATVPPSAEDELDASPGLLRERFLAFGRAVEQEAADYDEQRLIVRLQAECFKPEHSPLRPQRQRTWPLVLAGALAASALVVAMGIVAVQIATTWPAGTQVVVTPAPGEVFSPSVPDSIAHNHMPAAPELRPTYGVSSWDDPLDVEIQAAQSRLADLRGQDGVDGTLTSLSNELDSMSYDLEGGSL